MQRELWKRFAIALLEVVAIVLVVWALVSLLQSLGISNAGADEYYETRYVLCMDYVNARVSPNKKQEPIGRFETGDVVYTDGKKKNGYLHCVNLDFEETEGWVFAGYLTEDKPEAVWRNATIVSKGRLAARKYVGGKRTRWLQSGATVNVYYWSDDWCLTNCGYVQSQYLELEGE